MNFFKSDINKYKRYWHLLKFKPGNHQMLEKGSPPYSLWKWETCSHPTPHHSFLDGLAHGRSITCPFLSFLSPISRLRWNSLATIDFSDRFNALVGHCGYDVIFSLNLKIQTWEEVENSWGQTAVSTACQRAYILSVIWQPDNRGCLPVVCTWAR